jgi:hypothetical protein
MGAFEFVMSEGPDAGTAWAFPSTHFTIGSSEACHVRFPATQVQPTHAEVLFDPAGVPWIRDLTGQRLLWLEGEIKEQGPLQVGAFVRLGSLELVVRQQGVRSSPSGTIAPTNTALVEGTVIDGRYRIIGKLAAGGMGEVYRAQHVELGKPMALKVMRPELSADPDFVARFKREAVAASRIGQQNIVDISDFGRTESGRFYFVMEYLDGATLTSLISSEGAQPLARIVKLSVQIARALSAAHALAIVHRDLKPDNIVVLQRPGQADLVKVLDFGVAKVSHGQGEGGQTALGVVVGTPQYMSPEQAKAIPADVRSDIYSLGLIIYELITGRPTFSAETPSMLMVKHVTESPPPLRPSTAVEVPPALEALVMRMLAKEPAARPQTMDEVIAALESLGQSPAPVKRTSRVGLWAGVGVLAVGALGVVLFKRPVEAPVVEKPVVVVEKPVVVAPPVVATQVKLTFESNAEKTEISEGGTRLGAAPFTLSRDAGAEADLEFTAPGFKPLQRHVRFEAEQTIALELEKETPAVVKPAVGGKKPVRPAPSEDPYAQ